MAIYTIVIYGLIAGWAIFSIFYIIKLSKGKDIVSYVYDSIPTVFTTLGVLGTFVGIFFGLQKFDVTQITDSIPPLLEGMKTAFLTSIFGIILSLIFGKISQIALHNAEIKMPPKPTDELAALQEMIIILKDNKEQSITNFQKLHKSITGDSDDSINTQFVKLRNTISELHSSFDKQNEVLTQVQSALGGDKETSILTQVQKLRAEQKDNSKDIKEKIKSINDSIDNSNNTTTNKIDSIIESMNGNNKLISQKFDDFSELLAKNNTEALVEVMKRATEEFNTQMSALVEKLVQENFQELNNSVQKLNDWQHENKEMIISLTNQFKDVSNDFAIASTAISEITENTTKLTNDNSHLSKLIQELQKVLIDDTKFETIINELTSTIDTLKNNTDAFDETTNKLNNWVRNQMSFSDSVAKLLTRLEDIEKIKDINDVFWNNTKKQLNEGVSVIERASNQLSSDLENINAEFYERLNDTLQNLDTLIQRIIANYR